MSGFSATWLRARESADTAARSRAVVAMLKRVLPDRGLLRVTDLGSGTGANLRFLVPALGGHQAWYLIDHDAALLAEVPARLSEWAQHSGATVHAGDEFLRLTGPGFDCRVRCRREDLAGQLGELDFPADGLVSASALLDLVSHDWLHQLATRCATVRAPVLFALTYDGRMRFDPREPEDEVVTELVNRHQLRDKGFGPALGPGGGAHALEVFERVGYRVATERSDWRLGMHDADLQDALLEGWAAAASESSPEWAPRLRNWLERRRAHVRHGRSTLTVGHVDLAAWPAG